MKKTAQKLVIFGLSSVSAAVLGLYIWMGAENAYGSYKAHRSVVRANLAISLPETPDAAQVTDEPGRPGGRIILTLSDSVAAARIPTDEELAYAAAKRRAVWPKGSRPSAEDGKPALYPELVPICSCESSYSGTWRDMPRQYENGRVITNYGGGADVGMCQINVDAHGAEASELGFDLYSPEGNIGFANWLFEREGSAPWYKSEPCWRKAPIFSSSR